MKTTPRSSSHRRSQHDVTRDEHHVNARKDELASFLRSRRRRLTPADVGLPHGGRRRISSLRREDVAWLADIGITWYTWLEQGRPIKVAHDTLQRIASALRMDASESEYLEKLVRRHEEAGGVWQLPVCEHVRAFVEGYGEGYSALVGPRQDVLACNRAYARLYGLSANGEAGVLQRNTLWTMFTGEAARALFPAWEDVARRLLAIFRFAYADYVGEPAFETLIETLCERSTEFSTMWADLDVLAPTSWSIGPINDPVLRRPVALDTVTLTVPNAPGQTLIIHSAKSPAT